MSWKPIPIERFEVYEVSDCGEIRKCTPASPPEVIKASTNNYGYSMVRLKSVDGKKRDFPVHRLVALAFLPNPGGLPVVHHIDEIKTNNVVKNLQWCSYSQNNSFSKRLRAGSNAKRSYVIIQSNMDGTRVNSFNTIASAARAVGAKDQSLIARCCNNPAHNKSAYGYRWERIARK